MMNKYYLISSILIMIGLSFWNVERLNSQSLLSNQLLSEANSDFSTSTLSLNDSITKPASSPYKYQLALDILNTYSFSINYAGRIPDSKISVGAELGFAFEYNSHSYDRNIWEAGSFVGFARYSFSHVVHMDLGLAAMLYYYADDCSDCTGTFIGIHSALQLGYKYFYFGPKIKVGWASDDRNETAFGIICNFQLRLVLPWGKWK